MPPIWRAASTYIVYFVAVGAAYPYLPVHYRALGLDLGTIGLLAALAAATHCWLPRPGAPLQTCSDARA